MKRYFPYLLFVAAGLLPLRGDEPPNIVFFLTDDQRHDVLGCADYPVLQTPTIDRLASDGIRFTHMFVSESMCHASRASILSGLTGRTNTASGTIRNGYNTPEAVEVLYTDLLRDAGYRTGYIGKWHAWMPDGYDPSAHFDVFESIFRRPFFKELPDGSIRHETDLIVDRGIAFIKEQPAGQPFALNLWFNASHAEDKDQRPGFGHYPWPLSVDGEYAGETMPEPRLNDPAIYASQPDFLKETLNRERYFWRWDTPEKYQYNLRAYLRMLTGIDRAIERFLVELEALGLSENTIIVYSADNGYYMGNRGFAGKWSHYDESLRVPLIIQDPRLPESRRGTTRAALVMNIDLPATFLDWAGIPVPERYQGFSLAELVKDPGAGEPRDGTFHEHTTLRHLIPAWEGVRNREFKYARYVDEEPVYEFLHDLENDPDELFNLAKDPDYAGILEEMRSLCDAKVEAYGKPLPPRG